MADPDTWTSYVPIAGFDEFPVPGSIPYDMGGDGPLWLLPGGTGTGNGQDWPDLPYNGL